MTKTANNRQVELDFNNIDFARQLFGEHNNNLQRIAEATDVNINARGSKVFIQGESFATVVSDPTQPFKDEVFAVVKRGDKLGRMVKTKEWRYIEWDSGRNGAELYNQLSDPNEYHNLAEEPAYATIIYQLKNLIRAK